MMSTHIFIQVICLRTVAYPEFLCLFLQQGSQEGLLHSKYTPECLIFSLWRRQRIIEWAWTPGLQAQSISHFQSFFSEEPLRQLERKQEDNAGEGQVPAHSGHPRAGKEQEWREAGNFYHFISFCILGFVCIMKHLFAFLILKSNFFWRGRAGVNP